MLYNIMLSYYDNLFRLQLQTFTTTSFHSVPIARVRRQNY